MSLGPILLLLLYVLPSLIALQSRHPSRGGIIVINLFLGWTMVGWVGAFAWAMTKPAKQAQAPSSE